VALNFSSRSYTTERINEPRTLRIQNVPYIIVKATTACTYTRVNIYYRIMEKTKVPICVYIYIYIYTSAGVRVYTYTFYEREETESHNNGKHENTSTNIYSVDIYR